MPQEYVTELDCEVRAELDGILDGRYMGNRSLNTLSKNGMKKVNQFLMGPVKTGGQWYYTNTYKNRRRRG